MRNKRLGLSDTVYQQIQRYSEAARHGQGIWYAEATGLATLIGRRPDAEQLFVSAGRILANEAYEAISPAQRKTMHLLPTLVGRPLALRQMRKVATKYFRGSLTRTGSLLSLSVPNSVTVNSGTGITDFLHDQ